MSILMLPGYPLALANWGDSSSVVTTTLPPDIWVRPASAFAGLPTSNNSWAMTAPARGPADQ